MKHNFTLRIYKDEVNNPILSGIEDITISDITLVSKTSKFHNCIHKKNQKKFGFTFEIIGKLNRIGGSNNYPTLSFNGDYIDIEVKNFPRYPAFYQDNAAARNNLNGWGYTNYLNKGFPIQLLYREFEFIHI